MSFRRTDRRWVLPLVVATAVFAVALQARGLRAAPPQKLYPHVNLATIYQVDPNWPKKPADVAWGETPGVVVDKQDHVWVFTRANPPIQIYDAGGKFLRSWGEGLIRRAHYLRFDGQGNVWLADVGNHVVQQFTPDGKLLKTLGTPGTPGCDATHLNQPTDMAVTPEGEVFVADGYGNDRIVHFDRDGKFVNQWGKLGTAPGEFSLPHSIVRDSAGRLYVADRNNVRVQVFDAHGRFLDEWRNILVPWGLCINGKDEIWACGSSPMPWIGEQTHLSCPPKDQIVVRFATSGKVLSLWTFPKGKDGKEQPGELNWLHGVALDSQGNLYAVDITGRRVQKFVKTN